MSRVRKLGRIGKRGRRNPSRSIRMRSRNPSLRVRARSYSPRIGLTPEARRNLKRVGHVQLELADAPYHVQVRKGAGWITLGAFKSKMIATDYGRALAHRYRSKKFRVFWQDKNENPRLSASNSNGGASQTFRKIAYAAGRDAGNRSMRAAGRSRWSKKDFNAAAREFERLTRKKNPAPRASADGAEVDRAARLYQAFTGHRVTRARQVTLPRPRVGLAIGPVLGISYRTTRDGKRENYQHDFRPGARPLLAVSQDGRTLMLLGGAHRFTPRGIVDQR